MDPCEFFYSITRFQPWFHMDDMIGVYLRLYTFGMSPKRTKENKEPAFENVSCNHIVRSVLRQHMNVLHEGWYYFYHKDRD